MAAGLTDVQICSKALVRLGSDAIAAFSEGNGGPICAEIFPEIKLRVLSAAPWRFCAVQSQKLTRTLTEPPTQYKFEYNLPPDALTGLPRTVWNSAFNSGRGTPYTDFDIFGTKLLTNAEEVFIDYFRETETGEFPIHVATLYLYAMTAEIAFPITDQANITNTWFKIAWGTPEQGGKGGYFKEAQRIDSQGHPSQAIKNYPLTAVRHGSL